MQSIKRWVNSFAWWLYCSTKPNAQPMTPNEIIIKVSVETEDALRAIQEIKTAVEGLPWVGGLR